VSLYLAHVQLNPQLSDTHTPNKTKQGLAFLAAETAGAFDTNDTNNNDNDNDHAQDSNTLPPLARALAARVGYRRAALQVLAEMVRRSGGWEAVAGVVDAVAAAAAVGAGGVDVMGA
jgi:hypothetical protein